MILRILPIALLALGSSMFALDGQIGIHDPSTLIQCDGKYYVYGTGGNPLVSDDGWSWRPGTVPLDTGLAPDVIRLGDRYYMYVARNVGGQPGAEITMSSNRTRSTSRPKARSGSPRPGTARAAGGRSRRLTTHSSRSTCAREPRSPKAGRTRSFAATTAARVARWLPPSTNAATWLRMAFATS